MRLVLPARELFRCPICGYHGPFANLGSHLPRTDSMCVGCGSLERHRLLWLVLNRLAEKYAFSRMRALHFAPEPCIRRRLRKIFLKY
jgi:hypothetical protein